MKRNLITNRMRLAVITLFLSLLLIYSCEKDKVAVEEFGSISGYVFDEKTNDPLQNVNITTSPSSTSLLTDANGYFYIPEVLAGDVSITAKKNDYGSSSVNVNVKTDNTTNVIINMSESEDAVEIKVSEPVPTDGDEDLPINVTLSWFSEFDGNLDSTLVTYDILLFESNNLVQQLAGSGITDTFYLITELKYATAYFWQVVAYYDGTEKSRSDVWGFSTEPFEPLPFLLVKFKNGNYDIFNADTSALDTTTGQINVYHNFTNNVSLDWNPQYNHGGNKIAFTSNRDGLPHIFVMDNEGDNLQRITSLANISYFNNGESFCWSPDDEWILYSHYNKLYKVHKTGAFLTLIATAPTGREFRHCDWNGYTNKIVVQTMSDTIYKSEFYIMDDDGSNMQLLLADEPGRIDHPSFTIAGDYIIFTKDDDGFNSVDGRQLNAHIYSLKLDSLNLTDLSIGKAIGTNDLFPRLSTNGAEIIFVNTSNTGIGTKSVYVMNISGGGRTLLFDDATMPDFFQ